MSMTVVPLTEAQVAPLVEPHLAGLGSVLTEAWGRFAGLRAERPGDVFPISASSRGMLVSDYTHEPAHRLFKKVDGVVVEDRYGRPWVTLAGGTVSVRFRKLTSSLGLCRSDSDRATALAYHLPDPCLPDMPEATILTAGYVLDAAEIDIERLMLTCHFGDDLIYAIRIPGGATSADATTTIQLPITPLSEPVIRSGRTAARKRLAAKGDEE